MLAATIIGSAMAFIDGTVVNVALPQIQESLGATAVDAQWIVEACALFLAALILVGGSLGDHYGRRRVFLLGTGIFTLASVTCGLALTPGQLIAARAVQGVGAAPLVPGSPSIIGASFTEEDRGRAIGTWSGFSRITTAIGPVLGGYLVDNVSWRTAFLLSVPLALAVVPERIEQAGARIELQCVRTPVHIEVDLGLIWGGRCRGLRSRPGVGEHLGGHRSAHHRHRAGQEAPPADLARHVASLRRGWRTGSPRQPGSRCAGARARGIRSPLCRRSSWLPPPEPRPFVLRFRCLDLASSCPSPFVGFCPHAYRL